MTTTSTPIAATAPAEVNAADAGRRFASVDALRGVVLFTMLFVNDVAGVRGIPWWMHHYHPDNANGMTFVDWVFGGFLFIVGASIPLAFANRLARGEPIWRLLGHVILRTAGLLLLGVFMVNNERHPAPTSWPKHLWQTLVFVFGILAFLAPMGRSVQARKFSIVLRGIGFAGFAVLAFFFRDANGQWMATSWWGILGLIGWAYLVASIGYLLLRGHREGMVAAIAMLMGMYFIAKRGGFDGIWLNDYVNLGSMLGSHAGLAMAGVVLGCVILDRDTDALGKIRWAMVFGAVLLAGAAVAYPHYHINKNDATPAWCLICAAITCWLWAGLSMAIDVRGVSRPFGLFIRGGQNVLLAYLLMPLFIHLLSLTGVTFYGRWGALSPGMGIGRSLIAATVCVWLAGFLKDRGVRLRL
jgi:heparan-alpha-glucosaminide N-acetyltransferase